MQEDFPEPFHSQEGIWSGDPSPADTFVIMVGQL